MVCVEGRSTDGFLASVCDFVSGEHVCVYKGRSVFPSRKWVFLHCRRSSSSSNCNWVNTIRNQAPEPATVQ